jgi:tRNA (adenine37-N6)-methyltransferase
MRINYEPIGVIHSPFKEPAGIPIQPAAGAEIEGTVEVFEPYREGLADVDGFSHIMLLVHLHRSEGYRLRVVPFLDSVERGLFATRAPRRPNAIGLSVVRLERIEEGILHIRGVDLIDGTPLLDIKPYVPAFDDPQDVRIGWLQTFESRIPGRRSDDRFT